MRPTDRKSTRLNSSHGYISYLHSFPTRRSSDLTALKPEEIAYYRTLGLADLELIQGLGAWLPYEADRSEEHTSELQSRLHLVSTLFPYTTLFRSDGVEARGDRLLPHAGPGRSGTDPRPGRVASL